LVSKICQQTDKQTDKYADHNTGHLWWGDVLKTESSGGGSGMETVAIVAQQCQHINTTINVSQFTGVSTVLRASHQSTLSNN